MTDHEIQSGPDVKLGRYAYLFLGVGVIATLVSLVGYFNAADRPATLHSYLFALMFFMSVTLGCFGLTVLQHILQGKWGLPILRIFEAGGGVLTFVVMAALFIPVLTGASDIYPWANSAVVARDAVLQHREPYLNWGFYMVRFAIFFGVWIFYAWLMRSSVRKQETTHNFGEQRRRAWWCPPGLVFLFLSVTFAVTDWILALDAHWWSTMYPLWYVAGMALTAVSLAAVISCLNADRAPYNQIVNKSWTRDIGNLMFTFTMLWGYTNLGQYLIIWHGNTPETTTYLVNRSLGNWSYMSFALVIGQFFIPFFLLLSPTVKATPRKLAAVGIWILLMRVVDSFHVIEPFFRADLGLTWRDVLAFIGVGSLWAWTFSVNVSKLPLFPTYDPRLLEVEHAH